MFRHREINWKHVREYQPCSLGHDDFYDILHLIPSFCNLNFKRSCATQLMRGPGGEVNLPWRTCNHSRGREDAPREPLAPPFGYQTVETMSPKKLDFPRGLGLAKGKHWSLLSVRGYSSVPWEDFPQFWQPQAGQAVTQTVVTGGAAPWPGVLNYKHLLLLAFYLSLNLMSGPRTWTSGTLNYSFQRGQNK